MGKNRADCWADMLDEMQKDRSGCHSPAIWECLGMEGAGEICIQRVSSFASFMLYSCRKIKIEVHSETLGAGKLIF